MTGHVRTGWSTSQPCVVRHILLLSNATLLYDDRTVNQVEISAIQCDRDVCIKLDKEGVMHALSYTETRKKINTETSFMTVWTHNMCQCRNVPTFHRHTNGGIAGPTKTRVGFPDSSFFRIELLDTDAPLAKRTPYHQWQHFSSLGTCTNTEIQVTGMHCSFSYQ